MNRRRSTFSDAAVSYAAVGASQAPDVLGYPPAGFHSAETRWQLGSGELRFAASVDGLLSWRMVDAAGFSLSEVEKARADGYVGPTPSDISLSAGGEVTYSHDGRGHISAGDVVTVRRRGIGLLGDRHFRVVSVTKESRAVSLVFGTVDPEPFVGEFLLSVYHDDDDTVWSRVVQVVAPGATRWARLAFPLIRLGLRSVRFRLAKGLNPARVAHAREVAAAVPLDNPSGSDGDVTESRSGLGPGSETESGQGR